MQIFPHFLFYAIMVINNNYSKNMIKKNLLIFAIILFVFCFSPTIIFAEQGENKCVAPNCVSISDPLNLPKDGTGVQVLIGKIIKAALGVVGSLALLMFIYGGFVWMTSAGNSEKVEKGKNILIWATVGLVVIFSAYAMASFIIDAVITPPPSTP